ncbi:MAG: SAM-dependent methyltransferase [Cyanophyceae cyanobacterium]
MAILETVVPWGRSLDEYRRMFNLNPAEFGTILDCGGGPASFNAEMHQRGERVVSCDPIYQFSRREIAQRIEETYAVVLEAVRANQDRFVWNVISSPEELGRVRMASMKQFLADFPQGVKQGRYVTEALPQLSFSNHQFDLALCSHLLFTYSEQLSLEFHIASILEMCRVATEVRVFPLLTHFSGERSPHLQPVINTLRAKGYRVEIQPVSYEFQRHGNQLLRVLPNTNSM